MLFEQKNDKLEQSFFPYVNIKSCIIVTDVLCLVTSRYCYYIHLSYDTRLVPLCNCGNVLKSFIIRWTASFTPSIQNVNSTISFSEGSAAQ